MNLLAATTLSTKREAYAHHRRAVNFLFWETDYVFAVNHLDLVEDETAWRFSIYYVSYVGEGKERKAQKAEEPHFEQSFTLDELKQFLEDREIDFYTIWLPVEDNTVFV